MPMYSYKCNKCEYACKLFHQIGEEPKSCPKCNSDEYKKQLNSPSNIIVNIKDTPQKRIEKFIEETRQSVAEQIAEARKEIK